MIPPDGTLGSSSHIELHVHYVDYFVEAGLSRLVIEKMSQPAQATDQNHSGHCIFHHLKNKQSQPSNPNPNPWKSLVRTIKTINTTEHVSVKF